MKTNVKFKITIYGIVALLLLSMILVVSRQTVSSYAETTSYFSAEKYTESDNLLNDDGTESEKTIQTFAIEAKAANWGDSLTELPNVIPRQFLETTETKAVSSYNGAEYGFYASKNHEYFELLLIDFVYNYDDPEHSDLEYRIRIEPILQLVFTRAFENGQYRWEKYVIHDSKYYVANPRFAAALYNENALNFNDFGYSKEKDDGLIISQFRVNYGKISSAHEKDSTNPMLKFVAKEIFDISCIVLDQLTYGIGGTTVNVLKNIAELCSDTYDIGHETIVLADNENNIETRMSKTAQRDDPSKMGYSRCAAFIPSEEIILSDDSNSYAEMIVVLNDVNYKSRLTQVCEFDIVCKRSDFNLPQYVTGANDDPSYTIVDQTVLFDDQQPKFEINSSNFDGVSLPIYLFPNGEQRIYFTPQYSGKYSFELPLYAEMYLDGVKNNTFSLQANQTYVFEIKSTNNKKVIGNLKCFIEQYSTDNTYTVLPNSNKIISYCPTENAFKKIMTSNSNCRIALLDVDMNILTEIDSNTIYYNFLKYHKYYFVISNNSNNALQTKIEINPLKEMNLGVQYSALDNQLMRFTNNYDTSAYFKLTLENGNIASAIVTDKLGNVMSMEFETIDDCTVYTFLLASKETYYVRFVGTLYSNTLGIITVNPTQCIWKINGDAVDESTIRLKPNAIYSVQMDVYNGNFKLETINSFVCYSKGIDCSQSAGQLRIGKAKNDEIIILVPRVTPDFGLTIIIDDMIRKIKLVHCNETSEFDEIEVELGQEIQGVAIPIWKGHTFLGYFDAKNGKGKQYLDEEMRGVVSTMDSNISTLYAHWEKTVYTLTLHSEGDTWYEFTVNVKYGEPMPNITRPAPTYEGHEFIGYFTKTCATCRSCKNCDENSICKQCITCRKEKIYYTMKIVDDVDKAYSHRMNHYWVDGICNTFDNDDIIWDIDHDVKLFAHYELLNYYYFYDCVCPTEDNPYIGSAGVDFTHGVAITVEPITIKGYKFDHFEYGYDYYKNTATTLTLRPKLFRNPENAQIICKDFIYAYYIKDACVAQGTLITLANGTQVPVESLKGDEMLLVWNMLTGKLDAARIMFVDTDKAATYKVINLGFSDGTTVKVISEHGFWDYDLNKFVYLRSDASKYIGHWFNKGDARVQLTSVEVRDEYTTAYSPVTYGHLCYFVNGMLSMPGGIDGLFNIFEVDPSTMTINAEAMARDIATYGLFTYDEFAELVPVTEDVFNAFNGQYLKVAIGKGMITVEQLNNLANRYAEFFVEVE